MIELRKSETRGLADHGWLKSRHSFSFADYHNEERMGFRSLRVINEDRIEGGTGFGAHPHRDMEIISYVLDGALKHKDSMGNEAVILPGEVQRMSAGSGVVHSEFNERTDAVTHFLQIWIMPESRGGQPGYGQKSFEKDLNEKKLVLVVSKDAREGSIGISQDADLYISRTKKGDDVSIAMRPSRYVYVQAVKGSVRVNDGTELKAGDAAAIVDESKLTLRSLEDSEVLVFDLK